VSAFTTEPVAKLAHAPLIYCWWIHRAVLYTIIQFVGVGIHTSRAVASSYTGTVIDLLAVSFPVCVISPAIVHPSCLSSI